jgi:hypothetical protein
MFSSYLLTPYEAIARVVRGDMTAAMALSAVMRWSFAVAMYLLTPCPGITVWMMGCAWSRVRADSKILLSRARLG